MKSKIGTILIFVFLFLCYYFFATRVLLFVADRLLPNYGNVIPWLNPPREDSYYPWNSMGWVIATFVIALIATHVSLLRKREIVALFNKLIIERWDAELFDFGINIDLPVKIISLIFAIIIGYRLPTFGIHDWHIWGYPYPNLFWRTLAALGGVCVAYIFFRILFHCLCRVNILSFLKHFIQWRLWLAIIITNVLAITFVLMGRQVFFWDTAGYWHTSTELSTIIFSAPREFIGQVVYSIFHSDYNFLPAILPSLIMRIFGTSRLVFILAILNLYYIPVLIMVFAIAKNIQGDKVHNTMFADNTKPNGGFGFVVVLLDLPMMLYVTVLGFLDIGGVFFALLILWIFLSNNETNEKGEYLELDFLGGILLCILTLFRRWYIVFTLAFLICACLYCIFTGRHKKYLATFVGFVFPFILFFQDYLTGRLMGRYFADRYYAYSFPIGTDFRLFMRHFGFILILIVIAYVIYSWVKDHKNDGRWYMEKFNNNFSQEHAKYDMTFLLGFAATMFFILTRIQTHGQQHLLLYVAPLILIILHMTISENPNWVRWGICIVAVLSSASIFLPRTQPRYLAELTTYAPLPSFPGQPIVRDDAEELIALDDFLRGLDGLTAVMASSFTINPDLIARAGASLNPTRPHVPAEHILFLSGVDRRDGRPYSIIYADYILVSYPIQTHLAPTEQQVVVVPAQMLLENAPFSNAFERMDESFTLRDGVQVYIFRRTRPNTPVELQMLWDAIVIP